MSTRLDKVIDKAIADGRITGAAVMIMKDGKPDYERMAGFADKEHERPVTRDTIFRLASVTKPFVATTALAMVDKGLLALDQPVRDILPYFTPKTADGRTPVITVRHLLTHTAGFTYGATPADRYPPEARVEEGLGPGGLTFEESFTRLAAVPLVYEPGTQWIYSTAIDVLGAVISKAAGTTLHDALRAHVAGPLGLKDTGFHVTDTERLATPYADAKPKPVRMKDPHVVVSTDGEAVTFSPGRIFDPNAFQSGGAGAVSTPTEVMTFLEAMRTGDKGILSPALARAALVNQIGSIPRPAEDAGQRFTFIGAVIEDPDLSAKPLPKNALQWGGVYGHSWAIDPDGGMTILIMTNNAVEGCLGRFPTDIFRAIYY